MQIQGFIIHNNRFIVPRQLFGCLVTAYKTHVALTIERYHYRLETTLTNQRYLDLVVPVQSSNTLLVPRKSEFNLNVPGGSVQQGTQTWHLDSRNGSFQNDFAVNQLAWLYVCRYESRHKRAILGILCPAVKTICSLIPASQPRLDWG